MPTCKSFYLLLYILCRIWASQPFITSISCIRKMRLMESKWLSYCHKTSKRWTQGSRPGRSVCSFMLPQLRFIYLFIKASMHAILTKHLLGVRDGTWTTTATTLMLTLMPSTKLWLNIYFLYQSKQNRTTKSWGLIWKISHFWGHYFVSTCVLNVQNLTTRLLAWQPIQKLETTCTYFGRFLFPLYPLDKWKIRLRFVSNTQLRFQGRYWFLWGLLGSMSSDACRTPFHFCLTETISKRTLAAYQIIVSLKFLITGNEKQFPRQRKTKMFCPPVLSGV